MIPGIRDDDVRSSCFASLDVLSAKFGEDIPYSGGLDAGFPFRGRRVPFLSYMKGNSSRGGSERACGALDQHLAIRLAVRGQGDSGRRPLRVSRGSRRPA